MAGYSGSRSTGNNDNRSSEGGTSKWTIRKVARKITGLVIAGVLIASVATVASFSSGLPNFDQANQQQVKTDLHDPNVIVLHNHVHLTVKVDGRDIVVPANIGIDPALHRNRSMDILGSKNPPMSPLHTHGADGIIHIESTVAREFSLGQFLDIWGLKLEGKSVTMTADGKPVADYRNHVLRDGQQIVIEFTAKLQ